MADEKLDAGAEYRAGHRTTVVGPSPVFTTSDDRIVVSWPDGRGYSCEVSCDLIEAWVDWMNEARVERDRARDVAVALEQELARVLELSRSWDELARNVKNPHLAYNEGWADAKFGCADDIQRLFGNETETQQ